MRILTEIAIYDILGECTSKTNGINTIDHTYQVMTDQGWFEVRDDGITITLMNMYGQTAILRDLR